MAAGMDRRGPRAGGAAVRLTLLHGVRGRGTGALRAEVGQLRQRLLFPGDQRQAGLPPGRDPTPHRIRAMAAVAEDARRTGARLLMRSGAVRDERAFQREIGGAIPELRRRDPERSGGELAQGRPGADLDDVDEEGSSPFDLAGGLGRLDEDVVADHTPTVAQRHESRPACDHQAPARLLGFGRVWE